MRLRRALIFGSLSALFLVLCVYTMPPKGSALKTLKIGTVAAVSATQQNPFQQPGSLEFQLAQDFRASYGFPSSDNDVLAAAQSATGQQSISQFGVPLDPTEYADMLTRLKHQSEEGPLATAVDSLSKETGGMYIDQLHGGAYVISTIGTFSQSEQDHLRSLAPSGAMTEFQEVSHSAADLAKAQDEVQQLVLAQQHPALADPYSSINVRVYGAYVNYRANLLSVLVDQLPPSNDGFYASWDTLVVEGLLPPRAIVQFVVSGPIKPTDETHESSPGQMKSGIWLNFPNYYCTSNLDGYSPSTGNYYILSAGHCGNGAQIGARITNCNNVYSGTLTCDSNQYIGTLAVDPYLSGGIDVSATQLRFPGLASTYAWAYIYGNAHPEIDTISYTANSVVQGDTVCMGGASLNDNGYVHCGQVTGGTSGGGQYPASYYNCEGDSGGLVGNGSTAYGINVAAVIVQNNCTSTTSPQSWFVYINQALAAITNSIPGFTLITGPATAPNTWTAVQNEFGYKFCMDVAYNNSANGTTVWGWPCNGGPAQQWSLIPAGGIAGTYTIQRYYPYWNGGGSECLDADVNGPLDGAKVQEWQCNGTTQQEWVVVQEGSNPDDLNLLNVHNGGCLDMNIAAPGGGYSNGTPLQTWQCLGAGQSNQLWFLSAGGGN